MVCIKFAFLRMEIIIRDPRHGCDMDRNPAWHFAARALPTGAPLANIFIQKDARPIVIMGLVKKAWGIAEIAGKLPEMEDEDWKKVERVLVPLWNTYSRGS